MTHAAFGKPLGSLGQENTGTCHAKPCMSVTRCGYLVHKPLSTACLPSGPWDAALSAEELEEEGIDTSRWHPKWGDRMQELVFIGIGMDKEHILGRKFPCELWY